jgi:BTB/POZ domain
VKAARVASSINTMSPLSNNSNFNDNNLKAQEQDNANNNNSNLPSNPNTTLANQDLHKFFVSKKYGENLLTNLTKILRDSRFCDVDIICADKIIHAHRFILSAGSAYFEAMFRPEQNFDETERRSVTLHSISPEIVVALIEFIYSGMVEINQVGSIDF